MRRSRIYAVIRSGGKQYKVQPNQLLDVERLSSDVGAVLELSDVLMVVDGDVVTVGKPQVTGARVVAEVLEHGRGPKIIVFKYKNKTRYRRKNGHRQDYTRLAIRQILMDIEPVAATEPAEAPAKARPRPRRAPAKPAVAVQATLPEAAEVPAVEDEPDGYRGPEAEVAVRGSHRGRGDRRRGAEEPGQEALRRRRQPRRPATEEAPPKPPEEPGAAQKQRGIEAWHKRAAAAPLRPRQSIEAPR
jgi:large subunit ribosomal protein L21